jgi:hypothetical protein
LRNNRSGISIVVFICPYCHIYGSGTMAPLLAVHSAADFRRSSPEVDGEFFTSGQRGDVLSD